jgi:hypothetical protein
MPKGGATTAANSPSGPATSNTHHRIPRIRVQRFNFNCHRHKDAKWMQLRRHACLLRAKL